MSRIRFMALCLGSTLACTGGSPGTPRDGGPADGAAEPDSEPDPQPKPPRGVDVLTQHNDIGRTGANLAESKLTTANVAPGSFGKLFARPVDDEIYAQPLIVSDLALPDGTRRNVVYVATVGDSVYAFDADDPAASTPIWQRSLLGDGEVPPRNTDMYDACGGQYTDFSGNIGIVSTPVIDRATGTMYVVSRVRKGDVFTQRFHALSILDGRERPGSPVDITAAVPGNGDGSVNGQVTFDPLRQNQRSSLLLLDGVVYMSWAGHCDWWPYHGWIMGYDASSLAQVVVYNTSPEGGGAGVWQSGQGLSSDGTYLYAVTGNGTVGFDGDYGSPVNRGQSFLKLQRAGGTLDVVSWFTPYNWDYLESLDLDLGSAGMLLVPGTHLAVSGGKGGWLYVVDRDNMGGLSSNGGDDNILQSFALNDPLHLHGSPVFWDGPDGPHVYAWAEEDYLKVFPVRAPSYQPGSKVLDVDAMKKSAFKAEYGMPGGILSISADGNAAGSGILWASLPKKGDANQQVQPGVLRALDAADITHELWTSRLDPADDCGNFAKFSPTTIANGKVYLPSFSGQLCVYGLK